MSESAGKPDALQTLARICSPTCFVAKRLECVRLAGAFARNSARDEALRFMGFGRENHESIKPDSALVRD